MISQSETDQTEPLFTLSTIGMLGIAFTGGGKKDEELTGRERETAMFVSDCNLFYKAELY